MEMKSFFGLILQHKTSHDFLRFIGLGTGESHRQSTEMYAEVHETHVSVSIAPLT